MKYRRSNYNQVKAILFLFFLLSGTFAVGQSSFRLSTDASSVNKSSDVRGLMLMGGHTIGSVNYYRIAKFDYYGSKLWEKYISDFPFYYLPGDTDIRITVNNALLTDCKNGYLLASYIDSSVVIHD